MSPFGLTQRYIATAAQNPTGMQLLASNTLTGNAATLPSGTFVARDHLQVVAYVFGKTGAMTLDWDFNNDVGANYSWKFSTNLGGYSTGINDNHWNAYGNTNNPVLTVLDMVNLNAPVKRGSHQTNVDGGKGVVPAHTLGNFYYEAGAASQVTSITLTASANNIGTGSYILVYGADA